MRQINIFGIMALLLISFALVLVVITNFIVKLNPPSLEQKHIEDTAILDKSEFPTYIEDNNAVYDPVIPVHEKPIKQIEEPSKPYYLQEDFQSESPEIMDDVKVEKEEFILQEESQKKAISDVKIIPGGSPEKTDNYIPGSLSMSQATTPLSQKAPAALPPPSGSSVPAANPPHKNGDDGTNGTAGRMAMPGPPPSSIPKTPGSKSGSSPSTLPQFDSQFNKNGPVR